MLAWYFAAENSSYIFSVSWNYWCLYNKQNLFSALKIRHIRIKTSQMSSRKHLWCYIMFLKHSLRHQQPNALHCPLALGALYWLKPSSVTAVWHGSLPLPLHPLGHPPQPRPCFSSWTLLVDKHAFSFIFAFPMIACLKLGDRFGGARLRLWPYFWSERSLWLCHMSISSLQPRASPRMRVPPERMRRRQVAPRRPLQARIKAGGRRALLKKTVHLWLFYLILSALCSYIIKKGEEKSKG